MADIAYLRVSTGGQSLESQRAKLGAGPFDETYEDHGVSGAVPAMDRPAFAKMAAFIRKGDTLHVAAVDRLGRDALDIQATVRSLLDKGVAVDIRGLGRIARGVGELILAVLAQVADMERERIKERTESGREVARASLALTGLTHKGKASLGRPALMDGAAVAAWRAAGAKSLAATAAHFEVSLATAKRYCAAYPQTVAATVAAELEAIHESARPLSQPPGFADIFAKAAEAPRPAVQQIDLLAI